MPEVPGQPNSEEQAGFWQVLADRWRLALLAIISGGSGGGGYAVSLPDKTPLVQKWVIWRRGLVNGSPGPGIWFGMTSLKELIWIQISGILPTATAETSVSEAGIMNNNARHCR